MFGILTCIRRLTGLCLQWLHHRFIVWAKPGPTSRMLGTLTDLVRSKHELVAENALLRQQRILLHRQVKRPACPKTDRMLLVLLAKMARNWKQALFIVQPETLLRWHRQGFKLYWKDKSRAPSATPKISVETLALIKEMASNKFGLGFARVAQTSTIEILETPSYAPRANAICERCLGSVGRECLDHLLILHEKQLHRMPGASRHSFR